MKKKLNFFVSIGMLSSLFFGNLFTNSSSAQSRTVDNAIRGYTQYSKQRGKEEKKVDNSSKSSLAKFFKLAFSLFANFYLAKKMQDTLDQAGLTDSNEFSTRVGNLWKASKKLPNPKKFLFAIAKEPQLVKDFSNLSWYTSLSCTIFSFLGKGMRLFFDIPNFGPLFGALFGFRLAFTKTGKTTTEYLAQSVANVLDDSDEEGESIEKMDVGSIKKTVKKQKF